MIEFGDNVNYGVVYVRARRGDRADWVKKYLGGLKTGIFIGTRTLKNGVMVGPNAYEPARFAATEHFEAALVCPGPRSKPVFVPIFGIKK